MQKLFRREGTHTPTEVIYEILAQESCVPSKTSNRLFLRIPTLHSFSPTHPQLNTRWTFPRFTVHDEITSRMAFNAQ